MKSKGIIAVMWLVLGCCCCTRKECNKYDCCKIFHLVLLFIDKVNVISAWCYADVILFYDKQGGPRSEDVVTMRFADAVGATPNSQSKAVTTG